MVSPSASPCRPASPATTRLHPTPALRLQLLATFGNGRIEQFLHARNLTPEEMASPRYAAAIAATLARFHAIQLPVCYYCLCV